MLRNVTHLPKIVSKTPLIAVTSFGMHVMRTAFQQMMSNMEHVFRFVKMQLKGLTESQF